MKIEQVNELYEFLQGIAPEPVQVSRTRQPKLSKTQASTIIWFLQEHMKIISSQFECCTACKGLYDTHREGNESHCDYCRKG